MELSMQEIKKQVSEVLVDMAISHLFCVSRPKSVPLSMVKKEIKRCAETLDMELPGDSDVANALKGNKHVKFIDKVNFVHFFVDIQ